MRQIDNITPHEIDTLKLKGMLSDHALPREAQIQMDKSWIELIDKLLGPHGSNAFGGGEEIVRRYNSGKKTNLDHPLKRNFPTQVLGHWHESKDVNTPRGQHVSDGMPPLRGPSAQHSPLPWRADGKRITCGKDYTISKCYGPDAVQDAAFIVRACNNAQRLADALKSVTADIRNRKGSGNPIRYETLRKISEALDQLEEKQEQAQ